MSDNHAQLQAVFAAELEEINQRKILNNTGKIINRSNTDLLDFEQVLVPSESRSDCLNAILNELHTNENTSA
jgi:hypothetical protein